MQGPPSGPPTCPAQRRSGLSTSTAAWRSTGCWRATACAALQRGIACRPRRPQCGGSELCTATNTGFVRMCASQSICVRLEPGSIAAALRRGSAQGAAAATAVKRTASCSAAQLNQKVIGSRTARAAQGWRQPLAEMRSRNTHLTGRAAPLSAHWDPRWSTRCRHQHTIRHFAPCCACLARTGRCSEQSVATLPALRFAQMIGRDIAGNCRPVPPSHLRVAIRHGTTQAAHRHEFSANLACRREKRTRSTCCSTPI